MKKVLTTLITSVLVTIQPLNSSEMLSRIYQTQNSAEFIKEILHPDGIFDIRKARNFLSQMKADIKKEHGIEIDVNSAINESIKVMEQTGQFSESEIAVAREFYTQLFKSNEMTKKSQPFSKKKSKHKKAQQKELILPDKMAVGFVLMLSGALLCVIPSGLTQGLGTGMITTGLYAVIDGVREGEKPYYIDADTEKPIDQAPQPSIGVGTGF